MAIGTPAFRIPPGALSIVRSDTTSTFPAALGGYLVPAGRRFVLLGASVSHTGTGTAGDAFIATVPEFAASGTLLATRVGVTPETQTLSVACCIPIAAGGGCATVLTAGTAAEFTIWGYECSATGPNTLLRTSNVPPGAFAIVRSATSATTPLYTIPAGRKLTIVSAYISGANSAAIGSNCVLSADVVLIELNLPGTIGHRTAFSVTPLMVVGSATVSTSVDVSATGAGHHFVGFSGYETSWTG